MKFTKFIKQYNYSFLHKQQNLTQGTSFKRKFLRQAIIFQIAKTDYRLSNSFNAKA